MRSEGIRKYSSEIFETVAKNAEDAEEDRRATWLALALAKHSMLCEIAAQLAEANELQRFELGLDDDPPAKPHATAKPHAKPHATKKAPQVIR